MLEYFGKLAALDFGIQWIGWLVSSFLKTEKFFDLTGSATFIILATSSLTWKRPVFLRQKIHSGFVCVWAARLGLFLVNRVLKAGSDSRFDKVRSRPSKFFVYWTLQGVWVLATLAPTLILNSRTVDKPLHYVDYLGFDLWVFGFVFETVADYQKSVFRANPANKGKYIRSGLWSLSRHPNYFGEITLWTGLCMTSLTTVQHPAEYLSILSPMFVAFLLIKVSGIPILERMALERWGRSPAYLEYVKSTPKLIPYIW
ncbi:uncharacterized protein LOC115225879 [Argonauta hians]